ncbi:MAG: hypothetical protein PHX86_00955 [Caldisericia bacterium]|nr:hypothetical protein [Caldisericia bacterium]
MTDAIALKQHVADYDYGYLVAFLKSREEHFLSSEIVHSLYRNVTLEEIFTTLSHSRYSKIPFTLDPKDFENALWSFYFSEMETIESVLPEKYIFVFLERLHSVIFSQEEIFPFLENENFQKRLMSFVSLAKNGTEYTAKLAAYIVDRFNIFESIRRMIEPSFSSPIFYDGGNADDVSMNRLFQSHFGYVDIQLIPTMWIPYIEKERPVKEYDFTFMFRFETYWWQLIWKLIQEPSYDNTGPDYVISYFGHFILEIEMIKKLYICTRFQLPCTNLKEIILHAIG